MLGELLHGGQMMVLYPKDFASVRDGRPALRLKAERIVLSPLPSHFRHIEMETRFSVYRSGLGRREGVEVLEQAADIEALRAGRIIVQFYPFLSSKKPKPVNVTIELTPSATADMNVWLDSLLESGKLRP